MIDTPAWQMSDAQLEAEWKSIGRTKQLLRKKFFTELLHGRLPHNIRQTLRAYNDRLDYVLYEMDYRARQYEWIRRAIRVDGRRASGEVDKPTWLPAPNDARIYLPVDG